MYSLATRVGTVATRVAPSLGTFAALRHTARSAPTKALERLTNHIARVNPGLLPYFDTVAGFFPSLLQFITHSASEKLILVVELIIIMSRCLELIGAVIQTKTAAEAMIKPVTTLLTGKHEIDTVHAMMQSICILDENQKTTAALQIIFNVAMNNLSSYIVHPVEDEAYRATIEMLKVKLDTTIRESNINTCVSNLKKGIPLSDAPLVNIDEFGGRITGTRKRRKKRNKTGKRQLSKSPAF